MGSFGVKRSVWMDAIVEAMGARPGVVGRLLRDFTSETANELFPTAEACREFYARQRDFRASGRRDRRQPDVQVPGYRLFFEWEAVCRLSQE